MRLPDETQAALALRVTTRAATNATPLQLATIDPSVGTTIVPAPVNMYCKRTPRVCRCRRRCLLSIALGCRWLVFVAKFMSTCRRFVPGSHRFVLGFRFFHLVFDAHYPIWVFFFPLAPKLLPNLIAEWLVLERSQHGDDYILHRTRLPTPTRHTKPPTECLSSGSLQPVTCCLNAATRTHDRFRCQSLSNFLF